MAKPLYKEFYRTRGVRYSTMLIDPPSFPLTDLPKFSLFHYVNPYVVESGDAEIDESMVIFEGYNKKILYDSVDEYAKSEGPLRKLSIDTKQARLKWKQKNREKWLLGERPWKKANSIEELCVVHYGYLDIVHKYLETKDAAFHRWDNRYWTIWKSVADIAKETDRHQFISFSVPERLVGKTLLDKFTTEPPSIKMFGVFESNDGSGFAHLDLWRFLSVTHRAKSAINQVPPEHYRKVNLIFTGKTKRPVIINLAYLNSWIKGQPNTSDMASMVQQDVLMVQKLYLKLCMLLNGFGEEIGDEEVVGQNQFRRPEQKQEPEPDEEVVDNEDHEAEDLLKQDEEELSRDLDHSEDAGEEERFTPYIATKHPDNKIQGLIEPSELKVTEPVSFNKAIMQDLEQDIEALDKLTSIQIENSGISLKDMPADEEREPSIDPVVLREKVFGSGKPADKLKRRVADMAENNLITAAQYRNFEKLIATFQSSPDPYGSQMSRTKASEIKPEDLKIDEKLTKLKVSDSVPDKTMAEATLRSLNRSYVKNVMRKDILSVVNSIQKTGVVIRNHEVDISTSILGSVERHTLELTPINGQPSVIRFSLPVVDEEGKYQVSGNLYSLRAQWCDNPIRKIAPQIIGLSSYYGKTFVQTSQKQANNSLFWVKKQINLAIVTDNTFIKEVSPGNVFDNYLKAPFVYNGLAEDFDSFTAGENKLCFDYKLRAKTVNPELLKLIEVNGRVWCGWAPGNKPIVVDEDNLFYIVSKAGEEKIGDVYALLNLDVVKSPVDFSEVRVFSKYIPVGVVMGYFIGLSSLLVLIDAKYRVVLGRSQKNLEDYEFAVSFKDKSYIFDRRDRKTSLVVAGFLDYDKEIRKYTAEEFNHKAVYLNLFMSKKMNSLYVKELDMMDAAFVDHITEGVLQSMKEPTSFQGLLLRASEMLTTYDHPITQDRTAMRLRGYERMAGIAYMTIMQAIRNFNNRNVSGRSKIEMSPFDVINTIMKDTSVKIVEDINPIQNLKEAEIVTYSGVGGREKDTMTKHTRGSHVSSVGLDSESTVDNTGVGTVMYLSANPNIGDVRGTIKEKKELNPTSILSTAALLSPFSSKDN